MENKENTISDYQKKRTRKNVGANNYSNHGKLPPQAIELEEAVLGAIMLEKDALTSIIDVLKPEAFYKEAHQRIFEAIIALFTKSQPVDILTVTNELRVLGFLEIVGGPYYITQLTSRIASGANVEYHARIISEKHIQRELIRISSEIIRDAYEDTTDVFDLLDNAEKNLFAVSETNIRKNFESMDLLIHKAIKQVQSINLKEGEFSGLSTGFINLDRITAGWQKSDMVVLAARPGMGKTAFVLSMARNMATDFNIPVVFFSLEMSAVQLVMRLIASESEIPAQNLRKGNLSPEDWNQLNAKITKLSEAPLFIDDTPALSVFELRAKCRRLKAQKDIQCVIIDYMQLMNSGNDKGGGNRVEEISYISRSIKSLAKELDIPIIALSQLSRAVETRGGVKKPVLSDLRDSGAIEQDADIVCFIYRPDYYQSDDENNRNDNSGAAELIIAKHRNGSLADIPLKFVKSFAKFVDFDDGEYNFPELTPSNKFDSDNTGGPSIKIMQSKMNEEDENTPF